MIRVGITGQSGFVGTHLYNTLGLHPTRFERVPFQGSDFEDPARLGAFASGCDAIVHLAAMNRHPDPEAIHSTNLRLVNQLIAACQATGARPHILFASSTQEERDNPYGRSKREGRMRLEEWARGANAPFTGLIIPNVFGPFGRPHHNSVVATFCHQLAHGQAPRVEVDGELKLIYVGELVEAIIGRILSGSVSPGRSPGDAARDAGQPCQSVRVEHTSTLRVSALLGLLQSYREGYLARGTIPNLGDPLARNLFNTFLCYIDHQSLYPFPLDLKTDERGSFVETMRLGSGGQVSFSTTRPGVTRGHHFHTRKAERFAVIRGRAQIEMRRIGTEQPLTFALDGCRPAFVDMPIWHTHSITNVGPEELYTLFWISEHYDAEDPDTYFERVR